MDDATIEPVCNDKNMATLPPHRDNAPIEADNAGAAFPHNDNMSPEPLCNDDHALSGPPRNNDHAGPEPLCNNVHVRTVQ